MVQTNMTRPSALTTPGTAAMARRRAIRPSTFRASTAPTPAWTTPTAAPTPAATPAPTLTKVGWPFRRRWEAGPPMVPWAARSASGMPRGIRRRTTTMTTTTMPPRARAMSRRRICDAPTRSTRPRGTWTVGASMGWMARAMRSGAERPLRRATPSKTRWKLRRSTRRRAVRPRTRT